MAQLVRDASVFQRLGESEGQPEIRRAPARDTVTDLMRVMQAAGMASDLIDKLGNNELAKTAAHSIQEAKRKAAIRSKGAPVFDPASGERATLVQEAIQNRMAGVPDVQLQQPALMQAQVPMQPGTSLPGELQIPLPGQPPPMAPSLMGPTPEQAVPVGGQTPLTGLAAGQAGQLAPLDPSVTQAPIDPLPVQDQHLPKAVEVRNLPQAKMLAYRYGGDPDALNQILDSVDRLEGLSPTGLFGLARGEHYRKAQREIIEAAEKGQIYNDKIRIAREKIRVQVMKAVQSGWLDKFRAMKLLSGANKDSSITNLNRIREGLVKAQEGYYNRMPSKTPRNTYINIYNKQERHLDQDIERRRREAIQQVKESEAKLTKVKASKEEASTEFQTGIVKGLTAPLRRQEIRAARDKAESLRKTIAEASNSSSRRRIAKIFKKNGWGELSAGKKDKMISAARQKLKSLDTQIKQSERSWNSRLENLSKKIGKSEASLAKFQDLEKRINAQLKSQKLTAKRASALSAMLTMFKRSRDPKVRTKLLDYLERFKLIDLEKFEKEFE